MNAPPAAPASRSAAAAVTAEIETATDRLELETLRLKQLAATLQALLAQRPQPPSGEVTAAARMAYERALAKDAGATRG